MNCKQGDLAVIVKAPLPDEQHCIGKVIKCAELIKVNGFPCWIPETKLHGFRSVADYCLKPLRDSDGQDETLNWKDVPSEVTA